MRDVAGLAGVSIKSVSRVINREAGVSPATVHRVHAAVGALGYRHNLAASSLRRADRKTAAVGLVLDDVGNPFCAALHRGVEDEARRRHVVVLTGSNDENDERETEVVETFLTRQVDGLIVMPTSRDQTALLAARRSGRPVVFVDRPLGLADADTVTGDNRDAMCTAVEHLARQGHRRIAYIGDLPRIWTAAERYAGYVEGLAREGLRLRPELVRREVREAEQADAAATEILAAGPTAVVTGRNTLTIGVVRALRRAGLRSQIALVGFDDFPTADLLDPPVSVVAQDPIAMGQAAARLLFARLDGDDAPPRHVIVRNTFLARGSDVVGQPRTAAP